MRDTFSEMDDLRETLQSMRRGDYIAEIKEEESAFGRQLTELQKLRQDFDSYVRKQETEQKSQEERQRMERKRNLIVSLAAGSFTGIISGLFLYYWPQIIRFFCH